VHQLEFAFTDHERIEKLLHLIFIAGVVRRFIALHKHNFTFFKLLLLAINISSHKLHSRSQVKQFPQQHIRVTTEEPAA
jgi:EAL domain-containing protein (putative c-di-GMP-specific phosphodiesterase class I)